jgi:flagellar protein FliO/FliZ
MFLDETAEAVTNPEIGGASAGIVLQMVLMLALAALAIYGVVFLIKRLSRPSVARDPNLKVLASVPLGGDTYAAVVSLGTKAWLVGGGNGAGVSLIAEVEDQETLETLLLEDARKNAETGINRVLDFKALLNRFGNKNRNASVGIDTGTLSTAETLRKQQERLKGLRP